MLIATKRMRNSMMERKFFLDQILNWMGIETEKASGRSFCGTFINHDREKKAIVVTSSYRSHIFHLKYECKANVRISCRHRMKNELTDATYFSTGSSGRSTEVAKNGKSQIIGI